MTPSPFIVGITLMSIALVMEWWKIFEMMTLSRRSLAYIERKHPYLMTARELAIALLFSAAFGIFLTILVKQDYMPLTSPASILGG